MLDVQTCRNNLCSFVSISNIISPPPTNMNATDNQHKLQHDRWTAQILYLGEPSLCLRNKTISMEFQIYIQLILNNMTTSELPHFEFTVHIQDCSANLPIATFSGEGGIFYGQINSMNFNKLSHLVISYLINKRFYSTAFCTMNNCLIKAPHTRLDVINEKY